MKNYFTDKRLHYRFIFYEFLQKTFKLFFLSDLLEASEIVLLTHFSTVPIQQKYGQHSEIALLAHFSVVSVQKK